jgi:penicillin V acylase-like amidase (Ntn superfamily)
MEKKYIIIPVVIVLAFVAILLSFNGITQMIRLKSMEINVSSLTLDENKTLDSIRKVDNHPLYVMDDYGDHSQFLKLKDKYYWYMGIPKPKCSTFAIKDQNGDSFFGRNNDDLNCPVLLIFTHPKNGYASVSTADIRECGFDTGKQTPLDSRGGSTRLLYAPYCINDGMNEWGLTIGTMSVHTTPKVIVNPNKETMINGEMRRYILDHAKNTYEAIEILSKYNVHFPGELEHFLISDPSGNSAVVEWPDGNMQVIRSKEPWMAATNFTLYGSEDTIKKCQNEYEVTGKISNDTTGKRYWRYITLTDNLNKKYSEKMDASDAMNLLNKVSLVKAKDMDWPTQWSVVYNMNSGKISIAMGRNYDNIHNFKLEMKK